MKCAYLLTRTSTAVTFGKGDTTRSIKSVVPGNGSDLNN